MYGQNTDPTLYIAATYILGLIGILGYSLYIYSQRSKINRMLAALNSEENQNG